MITNVVTQLTKDGTEMFLFNDQGTVDRVLFDTVQLTNGALNLEEGNAPSQVGVKQAVTLAADQVVQCVNCNKYIAKAMSTGEQDNEICLGGCQ
jgi:hypothetical protein